MPIHPNSLANLNPARPGDVRNPNGANQYTKDRLLRTRFEAVCVAALAAEDPKTREEAMRGIAKAIVDGALARDPIVLTRLCSHLLRYDC